jgi:hypothetical protein
MNRRMLTMIATLSTVLCLAPASLALAGEDDDSDPAPPPAAQPVPQPSPPPQPAAPAPAPAPAPRPKPTPKAVRHPAQHTARPTGARQHTSRTTVQTQPVARSIQVSVVPRAAVQAGGGGMAEGPSQAALIGLGAGLVLVSMAGGGLTLRRRREES